MKKPYIIFLILLVLISSFLYAEKKGPLPVKDDNISLQLIPSLKHNIQVTYVESQSRVFFIDSITILKSDLLQSGMRSFFLNKAFQISKITINGTEVHVTEYANLDANNFTPRIRIHSIEDINEKCRMMEFIPKDVDIRTMPDTISVRIKYDLTLVNDMPSIIKVPGRFDIDGDAFWYPRNLNKHENLNIVFRSGDTSNLAINNQIVNYTQTGHLRQAEISCLDPADNPLLFSLISPGLK